MGSNSSYETLEDCGPRRLYTPGVYVDVTLSCRDSDLSHTMTFIVPVLKSQHSSSAVPSIASVCSAPRVYPHVYQHPNRTVAPAFFYSACPARPVHLMGIYLHREDVEGLGGRSGCSKGLRLV
jgi:hypothetical protein